MPNGTVTTHQMHQACRSVYCGNLPRDVTEAEIRALFNPVTNHVQSIRIVRKERGSYAFVELPNHEMCNQACSALVSDSNTTHPLCSILRPVASPRMPANRVLAI